MCCSTSFGTWRISDDSFEVGLSFGGVPERLSIPFAAVKGFFDPSVEFGLQFEQIAVPAPDAGAKPEAVPALKKSGDEAGQFAARADEAAPHHSGGAGRADARQSGRRPPPDDQAEKPPEKPTDKSAGGGEVVRLDRFRKK